MKWQSTRDQILKLVEDSENEIVFDTNVSQIMELITEYLLYQKENETPRTIKLEEAEEEFPSSHDPDTNR